MKFKSINVFFFTIFSLLLFGLGGCSDSGGGSTSGTSSGGGTPDLIVWYVNTPSTGTSGSDINVGVDTANIGNGAAGTYRVEVYLSTNDIISTADTLLGSADVNSLAPGYIASISGSITLPTGLSSGIYYIGARVDTNYQVSELDETNNTSYGYSIYIGPAVADIDLVSSSFSAPATGTAGSTISVSEAVQNQGTDSSGSFRVATYLSTNDIISTGDTLISSRIVNNLTGGTSSSNTANITLPLGTTAGTYYIGVLIDDLNQVSETIESNNEPTPSAISIAAAPPESYPDITVSSFSAPAAATAGDNISISETILNQGAATSENFRVGVYLSTDNVINIYDTFIGYRNINGLASSASSSNTADFTIPVSTWGGNYYIGVLADDQDTVPELDHTNNSYTPVAIAIAEAPKPDLIISAFSAPATGTAGETISVSETVLNQGVSTSENFIVGVYLSTDSYVSNTDILIGHRTINGIGDASSDSSSDSNTGDVTLPVAIPSGDYYLGVYADTQYDISESDENNNRSSSSSLISITGIVVPDAADDFEEDDLSSDAKAITAGISQGHNFFDDPEDWLSFTAGAGNLYTIETSILASSADTKLYLYDSAGVQLAYNDDGGEGWASKISWTAPANGNYYIKVQSYNDATGSGKTYSILLTEEVPPSGENQCSSVTGCTGAYSGSGYEVWTFNNNTGSNVDLPIEISGLSNNKIMVTFSNVTGNDLTLPDGVGAGTYNMAMMADSAKSESNEREQNQIPEYVQQFNDNPLEPVEGERVQASADVIAPVMDTVGVTTRSWKTSDVSANSYDPVQTTLRGQTTLDNGNTVKIWIANDMWVTDNTHERMNQEKINVILQKFATNTNDIYSMVRDIAGDEWGTHPYNNLIPTTTDVIDIVYYDINNDGPWGVLGFFWAANNYLTSSIAYSNESLVFFMDAPTFGEDSDYDGTWEISDSGPNKMLGTLAHEFQHMIHFYQKYIKLGASSETWLNEMASMTVEDILATYIGGTGTGPALGDGSRLSNYVDTPICNITLWSSSTSGDCSVYDSYATAYAFGGYLVRHYGGKSFLTDIIQSNKTGITDAIGYALTQNGYSETWQDVFRRWGSSLSMNPSIAAVPEKYGYPQRQDATYNIQQANMYGFSASYQPRVFQTPPATLRSYSNVVWGKSTGVTGISNTSINVPNGVQATVVVSP